MFCLLPAVADRFLEAIKTGEINPGELAAMTSAERHSFFSKMVGEGDAKSVNALFESKLLLKNQQQGMVTWAKKISGITPDVRRDLISRIQKMDKFLSPAEESQFLKDLASTKLGADVTHAEAATIAQLSKGVEDAKAAMEKGGNRLDYGRAKVALANYVNHLQDQTTKLKGKQLLTNPVRHPIETVSSVAGQAKSIKASLDNSAIFRQGWKTLFTNPVIWQKNARQSFVDIARQLGNKPVMDEVKADIHSRPTYDKMVKAKLAIGTVEEAYPSTLPEKVPVLGRLYKASESAYTGFVYRQRADIFDKYLQIAENAGVKINDKTQLESIGKLVNALTGRGYLGPSGERVAGVVNNVFFSPRFLKSQVDTLTAHQFQKGVTPFVRGQAVINLVKIITGSAAILAIANALMPGSVETDPRSSNFGKIKVGDTTFDISGGMGSVLVVAARLASGQSKSGNGQITSLTSGGFGQPTRKDVLYNFAEGKLSPAAAVVKDLMAGKDFQGNKPTLSNELNNLFTPLPITNYQDLSSNPAAAPTIVAMMADALGISVTTRQNKDVFVNQIAQYAKDNNVSLSEAQTKLFGPGAITKSTNGTVIYQRMSAADAAKAAKALGKNGNKTLTLDHVIPLELGGTNALSNLKLTPSGKAHADDKVENILGQALKDGKISGKDAQNLITQYKAGKVTGQAVYDKVGQHDQYKLDKAAASKATRASKK